jgi:hypothetical protein
MFRGRPFLIFDRFMPRRIEAKIFDHGKRGMTRKKSSGNDSRANARRIRAGNGYSSLQVMVETYAGPETRSTDAKGRVGLRNTFAKATVITKQLNENELRIRKARVIPEDEIRFSEEASVVLSNRERDRFLRALDHPPKPNAALRRLMAREAETRG